MRKIVQNMLHAIRHGQPSTIGNTAIIPDSLFHTEDGFDDEWGIAVQLHGSPIAFVPDDVDAPVRISLAGFDTATTRSRLSAILWEYCGATVQRHRGTTYVRRAQCADTVDPGLVLQPLPLTGWAAVERKHVRARLEYL